MSSASDSPHPLSSSSSEVDVDVGVDVVEVDDTSSAPSATSSPRPIHPFLMAMVVGCRLTADDITAGASVKTWRRHEEDGRRIVLRLVHADDFRRRAPELPRHNRAEG